MDHYENFPVASLLLPSRLRRPVSRIYVFARTADDLADEGDATPAERLAALKQYKEALEAIELGKQTDHPVFAPLAEEIRAFRLPLQPFHDLLDAFSQDVLKTRYADYPELLDYCRRSANPVGRLMLALYGVQDEASLRQSDAICSALQLTNFWQDIAVDWQKGRVYLPQSDLKRMGIAESRIGEGRWSAEWAALMDFEIDRTRSLMLAGAPLVHTLPGRLGLELRLVVQGGLRILERLQRQRGNIFKSRPVLGKWDWTVMVIRALVYRFR